MSPRDGEAGRTCLACRRRRPRAELIRIVRATDGSACFDLEGRLPGRGAWFCAAPACLAAVSPGALSHVLRAPARLPDPAARRTELARTLARRVAGLLSIARKSGAVAVGPAGVRAALSAGRAALVLVADDLPPDTLASWAQRCAPVPRRSVGDAAALGALLGGRPAPAAAVAAGGLAAALVQAIDRWHAFSDESCDNERLNDESAETAASSGAAAGGG